MKCKCIKGIADSDNVNVIVMQGDVVQFIENDDSWVYVEGIDGWCKGMELNFSPKQFVEHFAIIHN